METRACVLGLAVGDDHARTRKLLSQYREAWLTGDFREAVACFRRFGRAVARHLRWEEQSVVQPLRHRFSLHQYHVVQRDAESHQAVRAAFQRIDELLPASTGLDRGGDRRILESVAALEVLLDAHRTLHEDQLLVELEDLLTPEAAERTAGLLDGHARRPD